MADGSSDLLIKINADTSNATKAYDDIRDKTSDLEDSLSKVALVSAAAFTALTAEIYLSVNAYQDQQKASAELSSALQNQGIFTEELKEQYVQYAEAVSATTGVEAASIEKAQAVAQAYLGQTKITADLTKAIVDYGAKTGDINSAAEKIGRTIGTNTNAFARQGLVIDETSSTAERYTKTLAFVQTQSQGLADQLNVADGYTQALSTAFKDFQAEIGSNFAPVLAAARETLVAFFGVFKNNPVLADLAAAAIAAGAAVAGLITFLIAAGGAFLVLQAAVVAFGTSVAVVAPWLLAIGLLVAAVVFLANNWDKTVAGIKAAAQGAVTFMIELFSGLADVIQGAFSLDPDKIKAGLAQITGAYAKAKDDTIATFKAVTAARKAELETQNADKKAAADKEAALKAQQQALLAQTRAAEISLINLQNSGASADIIKLKTEEISTLKALQKTQDQTEIQSLQTKLSQIKALEQEQIVEDLEKTTEYNSAKLQLGKDLATQGIQITTQLNKQEVAQITATAKSEEQIEKDLQTKLLTAQIKSDNQFLADKKQYGISVATINQAIHSTEVQGATDAASNLVALEQSKNDTLKTIGKVAAVEQITIKTAESAINIFEGFSTIPIVGYALGIAGAAAAILYGGEQISNVLSANQGGLVTGGIAGIDSVPALLTPGELVVPQKNFDQVVGAVQSQNSDSGSGGSSSIEAQMLSVLQDIDGKFSNPQQTIINGDISSDKTFIDYLCKQISDALEFRNAKIYGVNVGKVGLRT